MFRRILYPIGRLSLCAVLLVGAMSLHGSIRPASAQETATEDAAESAEESTYFELTRSDDRTTRMIADRYFNLVKRQEWSDSTGKSKVIARYLEHDPDLKWVKLRAVKGSGTDRVAKEITVPIEKLSKTCQSRVRQIDTLQKKLDELLASAESDEAETGDVLAAGEGEFVDRGAPMRDERGIEPEAFGREGPREGPPAGPAPVNPQPAAAEQIAAPAATDDDPLGFAAVDLSTAAPGAGPPAFAPPGLPHTPSAAAGDGDRGEWATSYAAFQANFAVEQDERGEPKIDWGELDELRTIGEAVANLQNDPRRKATNAWADRLGEVRWEATFQSFLPGEEAMRMAFDLPQLPPPLQIEFVLDEEHLTPEDWNQNSANAGNRLSFTGRLAMAGPTSILVYVRDPKPAAPARGR